MKRYIIALLMSLSFGSLMAQVDYIAGKVVDESGDLLPGATIHWKNTNTGTVAFDGTFELSLSKESDILVVSFVGFNNFEEIVKVGTDLTITLSSNTQLEEFEVKDGRGDNYVSTLQTANIEYIGTGELRKAACCTLAESFETNGTVDVSYTDAITGTKEVKMLGLSGAYTQLLAEKRPQVRGLGSPHVFDYYPGTWVKGIQLSKGIGTVENGFDNVVGQINFELDKPWEGDKVFLNTYLNTFGRMEANLHLNYPITDKWSMGALLHASGNRNQLDVNDDKFLDTAQKTTLNGLYRLFYRGTYLRSQLNVHYVNGQTLSGQVNMGIDDPYLVDLDHERLEVFGKIGYVGFKDPDKSIGFIYNLSKYNLDETYGRLRPRTGQQEAAYTNLMFVSQPGSSAKISTGISASYSDLTQRFINLDYNLLERQVGAFVEFSTSFVPPVDTCESAELVEPVKQDLSFFERLGMIAGLRVDQHNLYGRLISPRLSLKYNFNDKSVIRMNAGRGFKTPYILSENIGMMVTSSSFIIDEDLDIEEAWNMGLNFTKETNFKGRTLVVNADLYYSLFQNKIVLDMEQAHDRVHFYNQKDQTRSLYFLVMANLELTKQMRFRGAYKFNHYEVGFASGLRTPPLFARHRGLITLEYTSKNELWDFNMSTQFVGKQNFAAQIGIPDIIDITNHVGVAPDYQLYNIHINRKFSDKFEAYIGGENLSNFIQERPIIDYENPFGSHFNASQIYAPTLGIRAYVGMRWILK